MTTPQAPRKQFTKNAHCSYCGASFDGPDQPWPRNCSGCNNTSYVNPIPVAVVVQPVEQGVLCIRRDIEPKRGMLALPGGFIDMGESWQQAAARELREETGLVVEPEALELLTVKSAPDGTVLIFAKAPPLDAAALEAGLGAGDHEVSEQVVLQGLGGEAIAFDLHEAALRDFFDGRG